MIMFEGYQGPDQSTDVNADLSFLCSSVPVNIIHMAQSMDVH